MKSGNLTLAISDYLPSFLLVSRDKTISLKKTILGKQNPLINFLADYLYIDWSTILEPNNNDVNNSLQIFLTEITDLLDIYMPIRKVTQKEYKTRFKPWIEYCHN